MPSKGFLFDWNLGFCTHQSMVSMAFSHASLIASAWKAKTINARIFFQWGLRNFAANLTSLKTNIWTLYITTKFHKLTQLTLATCQDRVLASSEFYLIAWSEW